MLVLWKYMCFCSKWLLWIKNQQGNECSIVSVCLLRSLMFPNPVLECACVGNKRPCFFQTLEMFPWEAPFEKIILKEHFLGRLLLEMLLLMTEIWNALTSLKQAHCQTSNHGNGFWENNLGMSWNLGLQAGFSVKYLTHCFCPLVTINFFPPKNWNETTSEMYFDFEMWKICIKQRWIQTAIS